MQYVCPLCGGALKLRNGKRGDFWGCSNFARLNCRFTCDGKLNEAQMQTRLAEAEEKKNKIRKIRSLPWSDYQLDIFKNVLYGRGNIIVEAGPGSAKTTVIVEATNRVMEKIRPRSVIVLSFNKHIAMEIGELLPPGVRSSTVHSVGYNACKRHLNNPTVDTGKLNLIIDEVLPNNRDEFDLAENPHADILQRNEDRRTIKSLITLIKGTLDEVTQENIANLIAKFSIEANQPASYYMHYINEIIDLCMRHTKTIDYDDMIWLPVMLGLPIPKYDFIFGDEGQDFNPCQMQFLSRMIGNNSKVIIVGDRNQSIYGFRGADCEAMAKFQRLLDATPMPLYISYRCPRLVVNLAQELVPELKAAPNAIDGELLQMKAEDCYDKAKDDNDMFICRTNAPLLPAVFALIKRGKKAVMKGRDFGKNLISLIEMVGGHTLNAMLEKLEDWSKKELSKLHSMDANDATIQVHLDKIECIEFLAMQYENLLELKSGIRSIFDDDKKGITCATAHRSKGLEANNVYILRPDLMPFPFVKQEWEVLQEKNIQFVAWTRAKKKLVFVEGGDET